MRRCLVILVGAFPLALAGCGATTISSSKAEKFVKKALAAEPKSVDCPDDVEAKKGGTLTCKVTTADGTKLEVTLHMTDADGHVTVSPGDVRPAG
jgi:hypothetical protein